MAAWASKFRDEFPVTESWAYLNHATHGPFSRRTLEAIDRVAHSWAEPPTMDGAARDAAIVTARENLAALAGGSAQRAAFVGNLGDALSLCAAGIDWQDGDNVVIPRDEFPSVVYPFLNLGHRGVELRLVEKDERGFTNLSRIADRIDRRTRALVISHVEFMDGFRNDLAAIGRLCRERDVLSLVDATQSMGALPIDADLNQIDVIAAHGYKWLMASYGFGAIHFSERAIERIRPVYVGRLSVNKGFEDLDYALDWRDGAARYQTGGINWLSLAAFNASAELIRAADPAQTERHTLALTDRLLAAVAERGYTVTSCRDVSTRSQVVSFTSGSRGSDATLVANLLERHVAVSLRGRGVRVSPYFYNTDDDVDRLIEALPRRA
ncbi:MAG: aminotransferase class V-fold PLP-dependent enzyme [Chloroflexota bacterium]